MSIQKKKLITEKVRLHPKNKHRSRYDLKVLAQTCPELQSFITQNIYGDESIDFANPSAVKILNTALLKHYYNIEYWDIPHNYLCPPIPGRADYIHYMADLIYQDENLKNQIIRCLDIGMGANCVYPIIGHAEYNWDFVGSEIDEKALASATKIIAQNPSLKNHVECRLQLQEQDIFHGIIMPDDTFDLAICNPPFHASEEEAKAASLRKVRNLKQKNIKSPIRNFSGQPHELWCDGGEERFVSKMIFQSTQFKNQCRWFSALISKQSHLQELYHLLDKVRAYEIKTIPMGQGNKVSRILAWRF